MKKAINLILTLILSTVVLALPPTFHQFYGTVKYSDGTNAVDDTLITAKVNNVEFSTVTSQGKYGYSSLFFVENANNGDVIEFYVGGIKEAEYLFEDSATTQLNLVIEDNCGDTLCTGSESCSSCAIDCGACQSGDDSGSSGGGGGGGGSRKESPLQETKPETTAEPKEPEIPKEDEEKGNITKAEEKLNKTTKLAPARIDTIKKKAKDKFVLSIIVLIFLSFILSFYFLIGSKRHYPK